MDKDTLQKAIKDGLEREFVVGIKAGHSKRYDSKQTNGQVYRILNEKFGFNIMDGIIVGLFKEIKAKKPSLSRVVKKAYLLEVNRLNLGYKTGQLLKSMGIIMKNNNNKGGK